MNRAIAFAGPSTNQLQLSDWPHVDFAPPAQAGDIAAASAAGYRVIGLIDGFFGASRSPWHKEIAWAMRDGARVFGASSMGALRAAELHTLGMVGVGRVFQLYADGTVTADDEVTLIHAPAEAGYMPLSEALANIRLNAIDAVTAGAMAPEAFELLMSAGRGVHYSERSLPSIVAEAERIAAAARPGAASVIDGALDGVRRFAAGWQETGIDWKAEDARAMLNAMEAAIAGHDIGGATEALAGLQLTAQYAAFVEGIGAP